MVKYEPSVVSRSAAALQDDGLHADPLQRHGRGRPGDSASYDERVHPVILSYEILIVRFSKESVMAPRVNPSGELGLAMQRYQRSVQAFDDAVGRRLGLGPADLRCLDWLADGPKSAGQLATATGLPRRRPPP